MSRLGLGVEGYRSRDFECCKEMISKISIIQRFFVCCIAFAGKKQPKHVGKIPEI